MSKGISIGPVGAATTIVRPALYSSAKPSPTELSPSDSVAQPPASDPVRNDLAGPPPYPMRSVSPHAAAELSPIAYEVPDAPRRELAGGPLDEPTRQYNAYGRVLERTRERPRSSKADRTI